MDPVIIQSLAGLLGSIIIAFLTARFTVANAVKQFHAEHWWERKADAYSRIIESLHHMKNYCEREMEDLSGERKLPEDTAKILKTRMSEAAEEIARAYDLGSFLICDEAVDLLDKLQKDREKARNEAQCYYDDLDGEWGAVTECLTTIREIAKRDLRVSQELSLGASIARMMKLRAPGKIVNQRMTGQNAD